MSATFGNDQATENLKEEALTLLPLLKYELKELADEASDEILLKFLLWKPNVLRASERYRALRTWQSAHPWCQSPPLQLICDDTLVKHMRDQIVIAPESLRAKDGSCVVVGRLRNNDMTDGRTPQNVCRMMLYMIDHMLQRQDAQLHGVTVFHDLRGLSKKNIHVGIPKLLVGAVLGTLPLKIKGMYLWNAPSFFKSMFAVISTMLFPRKLKERVHFVDDIQVMYEVIDQEKLLVEHGGKLEFDVNEWVKMQSEKETRQQLHSLYSLSSEN